MQIMYNLMATGGAAVVKTYVEDVYSAFTYNGGASVIQNGLDMTKPFLTWFKGRNAASNNALIDTMRGFDKALLTNTTTAQSTIFSPVITGEAHGSFTLASTGLADYNAGGQTYIVRTYLPTPKFFDMVTWVGDGGLDRSIPHKLACAPGLVIVRNVSAGGQWLVWHRSLAAFQYLDLSGPAGPVTTGAPAKVYADNSSLYVHQDGSTYVENKAGNTYVAYLWAHDPSSNGIVQCGSYTGNGSTSGPVITLGWEPQHILIKRADAASGAWVNFDSLRGMGAFGSDDVMGYPGGDGSSNSIVDGSATTLLTPRADGFTLDTAISNLNVSAVTYIYMAIRKGPMRVPSNGSQFFCPVTYTGTGTTIVNTTPGWPVDSLIFKQRSATSNTRLFDRKTPLKYNYLDAVSIQVTTSAVGFDNPLGFSLNGITGANTNGVATVAYAFRYAPKVFTTVTYKGDSTLGSLRQIPHDLQATPELVLCKARDSTEDWQVTTPSYRSLSTTRTQAGVAGGNSPYFSSTYVTPLGMASVSTTPNTTGTTYIALLFASCPGISKVFTYTGNGGTSGVNGNLQYIDCGFTTGARFVLIKTVDVAGDWLVWDSARGIGLAGDTDPHLSLNTTAIEVSDNQLTTYPQGFGVYQTATLNLNVTGQNYIGLAIA